VVKLRIRNQGLVLGLAIVSLILLPEAEMVTAVNTKANAIHLACQIDVPGLAVVVDGGNVRGISLLDLDSVLIESCVRNVSTVDEYKMENGIRRNFYDNFD
jgi:hypothetical protein